MHLAWNLEISSPITLFQKIQSVIHIHWKFWLGVTSDTKLGSYWGGEVAQKVNLLYWMNMAIFWKQHTEFSMPLKN